MKPHKSRQRPAKNALSSYSVRIIAGKWRRQAIHFSKQANVRPTTDRIRETLFNWLQQDVEHMQCLDVFAGSGALGMEALSRGAAHVTFIDASLDALKTIDHTLRRLHCETFSTLHTKIPDGLRNLPAKTFDLVFLDPPYESDLLPICLDWLRQAQRLHAQSLCFVEQPRGKTLTLENQFTIVKQRKTRHTEYMLLRPIFE